MTSLATIEKHITAEQQRQQELAAEREQLEKQLVTGKGDEQTLAARLVTLGARIRASAEKLAGLHISREEQHRADALAAYDAACQEWQAAVAAQEAIEAQQAEHRAAIAALNAQLEPINEQHQLARGRYFKRQQQALDLGIQRAELTAIHMTYFK